MAPRKKRQATGDSQADALLRASPPADLEAERAVLGAALLDPAAIDAVASVPLVADDFYARSHGTIYGVLLDLRRQGVPPDAVTLAGALRDRGLLAEVGGPQEVGDLLGCVPSSANAVYYARRVRDQARLRAALVATHQAVQGLSDGAVPAQARLAALGAAVSDATRLPVDAGDANGVGAAVGQRFGLTDLGNARLFVAAFGPDVRFSAALDWLAWDGTRWRTNEDGAVQRLAHKVPDLIRTEARAEHDADRRKALEDHAEATESERSLHRLVKVAADLPGLPVAVSDLDRDPWLLNVENGTVDLRTGVLRPHARRDLLTRLAPARYDPAARSELWEAFLDTATGGRMDLGVYLQRIAGYCLTGDTREQCFFLFHGKGSNGKSTFVNAITGLLGDHARNAQFATLLEQRVGGVRSDLARLRGARAVSAIEARAGGRLDEGLVKQLTGGDPLTACFKFKDEFEFTPTFKLLLAANERPEIRGTDLGIWRRVRLVPFETTISPEKKDETLPGKLATSAVRSGILSWAVGGCLAWQRGGLAEPPEVLQATEAYRRAEDALGSFLNDRCLVAASASVGSTTLYRAYVDWCEGEGIRRPWKHKTFTQNLEGRAGIARTLDHHAGARFSGLALLDLPVENTSPSASHDRWSER